MACTIKIGVIAGTPVDTQMGVDFVKRQGFEALGYASASSPEEQNRLQFLEPEFLTQKVLDIIGDFESQKIFGTMFYCNSLSAAIDIEHIRRARPKSTVVTPLDVYRNLALKYKKIALWAANGQCLSAIEHIFYEQKPSIDIMGVSMLPVIKAIESGKLRKPSLKNLTWYRWDWSVLTPNVLFLAAPTCPIFSGSYPKAQHPHNRSGR